MSRADIEAALAAQHRDTLPPLPVQQAIAEAQGVDAAVCPLCSQGLVTADAAARVKRMLEAEERRQTTTAPVGKKR